jgi:hypothetical protein
MVLISTIPPAGGTSRRAASHPTEGGKKTDRLLIAMAAPLEREERGDGNRPRSGAA